MGKTYQLFDQNEGLSGTLITDIDHRQPQGPDRLVDPAAVGQNQYVFSFSIWDGAELTKNRAPSMWYFFTAFSQSL